MKPGTSRVCENYNPIEGHSSNPFELRKLPKCNAKKDDKIEIAENISDDMKILLPSFRENKDTINVIKIDASEFIEAQHKSEELSPLIQKVEKGIIIHTKGKGVQGSFRLGGNMKLKMRDLLRVSNCNKAVTSSAEKYGAPNKEFQKVEKDINGSEPC
ncbi:hypothetical protein NPIL_144991 [Nephila pilipes]|uniref:Uncharacterized protein n=1 Tax=Nephila pilipes TaxID=299642 RepID=A0A8X6UNL3_NEPPI|nr:hypothetical protein NPIL_144991 [Nephila pilipes]